MVLAVFFCCLMHFLLIVVSLSSLLDVHIMGQNRVNEKHVWENLALYVVLFNTRCCDSRLATI